MSERKINIPKQILKLPEQSSRTGLRFQRIRTPEGGQERLLIPRTFAVLCDLPAGIKKALLWLP